jgi:hypothetical protein
MFEETLVLEQWPMLELQSSICAEFLSACDDDDGSHHQNFNDCSLLHLQGRRESKKVKLSLCLIN